MDFTILVNDEYLKLVPNTNPANLKKKYVLSLANDFEDTQWRYDKFENFIWDNIGLTALSAQERKKLIGKSRSSLREAARNLRLTDKAGDIGQGSELAEVVLYGIMEHHFGALPVVPKIFYKQNPQDNAKGADSVHILLNGEDDFTLWFGEAKFYNNIEDSRLPAIIESVGKSLDGNKLKKENSIITNTIDLQLLIEDKSLLEKIKLALGGAASIDTIKPKIHVPILLLHECSITAASKEFDQQYIDQIKAFHIQRAKSYFEKQASTLASSITKYAEITFHIILFPVPDRPELVKRFSDEVAFHKGE